MGLLDRILGKRRTEADASAEGRARQGRLAGIGTIQSDDEQQATRQRMEAEMNAQRDRRDHPTPPEG